MMCQLRTASPAFGLYVRMLFTSLFLNNCESGVLRRGFGARGKGYLRARVGSKWPFAPYLMLKNRLRALINSAIGSKYQEARKAPSKPSIMRYRNNCALILFKCFL